MLHVILLILKILGIILLSILLLLLLILCAVLFVSVTYRVEAEKKETLQVRAVGGWMFRLLSVHYRLDGADDWKQDLQVRVFGIPILKPFEEKKPKKKKGKKRPEGTAGENQSELQREETVGENRTRQQAQQNPAQPSEVKSMDRPGSLPEEKGVFGKLLYAIRSICGKIRNIGRKIKQAVKNLRETIGHLGNRKNDFLEFWNLEEHRRARSSIYKELRYLWKKSRPRRIEGQLHFGFEDPSVTGMCMGALSVLYAWYPEKFQLLPDFDREVLEGNILIKGRIRLYTAVLILWRVWFNKDIRQMYEHWQEL